MKRFFSAIKKTFLVFCLFLPILVSAINLNSASKKELQTLKGIGAKKAETIIQYRQSHGPFTRAEEVMKVKGIGKKIWHDNKNKIEVDEESKGIKKEEGELSIDANPASTASFAPLKGVRPKKVGAIIKKKEKRRFFGTLQDLTRPKERGKETPHHRQQGIGDWAEPIYPIPNRAY